ncbi:MAG: eukaryotic translation initiation factor 3 subunit A [Watsoniomyces obsoletus]|nr:MAG: eukaryotic translation initiation factor 3 subunit A [Watsoniomyces obsoletus]
MPPPPHAKPENVLKRAQELIAVGQTQAALSLLHEHVTSKRSRNSPITSLEPVMLLFVELSVDLRKGKLAKDGLYQYKNMAQNTNVGTIELVLKRFIELAEKKVTEAQAKADEVQSTLESTTTNVEDLEATETPESILLSTVSGEQSRDRTDRAIVTPWLKFLWETYRTVLDILRNNSRLEIMYQATALQAFQFCLQYARKTEFRRLCELLRNHVQNAAKYASQMHAINLNDPDTLQRHLDTRFRQLNVAVELELWQEAFRSVEDIHTLLSLSKRPAKNVMMANYFEKLTRIFLVSENYLFHAAAWSRYYNLLRSSAHVVAAGQSAKKDNPAVTEADMTRAASYVLLSALAIPVISTTRSRGALVDVDEAKKNKNARLTNLLGMSQAPTRAILFRDAMSKGLLKRVRPEIRELYNILEVDFHPLSICNKIAPILSQIGEDAEMGRYVQPLQQVILTRLFQQLSQVYESVELKFVYDLAQFPEPYQVASGTIEKFIMNGCKKGDLAIRIDHAVGVLTFDSDVFSSARALHPGSAAGSAEHEISSVQKLQSTPSEIIRSQLTRLAKSLYLTCQYVDPTFGQARAEAKAKALERAKAGAEAEHIETLARKAVIEKKKEAASSALAQKEKEEAMQKRRRAAELQEAENKRLAFEHSERERRRIQAEQDRIRREELKKQLEDLKSGAKGLDVGEVDLEDLDSNRLRAMKLAQLEKEKNELSERLRVTGKRIDHLERAFRREELKHLPEDAAAQREQDLAAYEKHKEETLREAKQKHQEEVALKHRLGRLVPAYETFRDEVRERRHEDFKSRRLAAERELKKQMDKRRREVRERKQRERKEREARERAEREEAERVQREEEEKAAREEEEQRKKAEEKAKRDEERRKLDEQAARQRQREEEALQRRKARDAETRAPVAERPSIRASAPVEKASESGGEQPARGPPRLALAGATGKPSWRERQEQKAGGGSGDAPSTTNNNDTRNGPSSVDGGAGASSASAGPRKFVPPALRDRLDPSAASGAPPRNMSGLSARARDSSPADSLTSRPGSSYTARAVSGSAGAGGPASSRDESPAPPSGLSKFAQGDPRINRARDESPADHAGLSSSSGNAPAAAGGNESGAGGPQKYRPGAFRGRKPPPQ